MHLVTSTVLLLDNQEVDYNLFFNPDTLRYLFYPLSLTTAWYALPSSGCIEMVANGMLRALKAMKSDTRQLTSLHLF